MAFIETNGIKLHYLDYPEGDGEPLILLHGLTVNGHFFDGAIDAGLAENRPIILVDLRGRGLSDKPDSGYRMSDHAKDIIGLLDVLQFESVVIGGHSFGGLLTFFLAANYPARVRKLVILDAAAEAARQEIANLIKPSLQRLETTLPSADAYIDSMKTVPYYHDGFWDAQLEAFYRSDLQILDDGSVITHASASHMSQAIDGVLAEDWFDHFTKINQRTLLLHAPEGFGPPGTPPVLSVDGARQTVEALKNCTYQQVPGNHITMMFGENVPHIVRAINTFIDE